MKIWTRKLQKRYDSEVAPKIDGMAVDTVIRFARATAPKPLWFYQRAELNNFTCCVHNVGSDVVIVRVA